MLGRAPTSKDGAAIEAVLVNKWVKGLHVAQEEARKLILANIEGEQQDWVKSTPHQSRTWTVSHIVQSQG